MRETQLFIKVNNKYQEVDLFDDVVIPITLKLTDIRQFGSKTSSFSLDFDIPHTNSNAKLFGLSTESEMYEAIFAVGKDYPAYLTTNSLTTFSGQFRLKKVIKQNRGNYIYYVGYLYGGTKNFIDELGTKKLIGNGNPSDDLSFSEYTVDATEMKLANFSDYLQTKYTDGTGWGLTLLDKTNKAAQAFSGGSQQWYTDECTPYLYAREIFDKIFSKSSYHFVSEFLMGTDFSTYIHDPRWANGIGKYDVNSIIYPYMKHNSNIQVEPSYSNITQNNLSTVASIASSEYIKNSGLSNALLLRDAMTLNSTDFTLQQTGNDDITAYTFTAVKNGYYAIDWNFDVDARAIIRNVFNDAPPSDTTWKFHLGGGQSSTVWIQLQKNGQLIGETSNRIFNQITFEGEEETDWFEDFSPTTGQTEACISLGSGNFHYSSNTLFLRAGDVVSLYMWVETPVRYTWWSSHYEEWRTRWCFERWLGGSYSEITVQDFYPKYLEVKMTGRSDSLNVISNSIGNGFYEENDFDPTVILNQKTSQVDFINKFIKAFNLYIEDVSGKINYKDGSIYGENTFRIEPYEIFYAPELGQNELNVKDWTNKIDWSSVEYRRCDDYLYNIQNFTKKQDGDFYNENYDKSFSLPYGNREIKGVYCVQDEKNEIPFNVSANLCGVVNSSTDVLQCPKVFALDKSNNVDKKKEYNDGFFFIWRNYMNTNTEIGTNYTLKLQSRLSSSYLNLTDYYTADTLNKGYGLDDANLNWGETSQYFQNMKGTIPTWNDLYNAFYAKEYNEKTAQDAMILRANAYLTTFDIYNLQLSDLIVVNGNYYHILEVSEWKNEKTPCQVELIKTKPNYTPAPVRQKAITLDEQPTLPVAVDVNSLQTEIQTLKSSFKRISDEYAKLSEQVKEMEKMMEK